MRVISGTARGKKLKSPEGQDVRPTLDRIKEDMFNIIGPAIRGKKVLDLFAGSGALSPRGRRSRSVRDAMAGSAGSPSAITVPV